jgi:hypothetical protein
VEGPVKASATLTRKTFVLPDPEGLPSWLRKIAAEFESVKALRGHEKLRCMELGDSIHTHWSKFKRAEAAERSAATAIGASLDQLAYEASRISRSDLTYRRRLRQSLDRLEADVLFRIRTIDAQLAMLERMARDLESIKSYLQAGVARSPFLHSDDESVLRGYPVQLDPLIGMLRALSTHSPMREALNEPLKAIESLRILLS